MRNCEGVEYVDEEGSRNSLYVGYLQDLTWLPKGLHTKPGYHPTYCLLTPDIVIPSTFQTLLFFHHLLASLLLLPFAQSSPFQSHSSMFILFLFIILAENLPWNFFLPSPSFLEFLHVSISLLTIISRMFQTKCRAIDV